jgi:hypothetical protein
MRERRSGFVSVSGDHYIFMKFDNFAIAKDAKFSKAA